MMPGHAARLPLRRPRRIALGLLVLVWGVQAIVTQSLLLREALVLMFGSEFAWGVVLFAWLFGVAVGAAFGGWLARCVVGGQRADIGLVVILVMLSLAAPVEIWVFRGARAWLGVEAGELLPLGKTALAAMLFISPASALVGMAFPLACGLAGGNDRPGSSVPTSPSSSDTGPLGRIYALESLGSLIGGAVFSFWAVEHLRPIQIAMLCGVITLAASGLLLACTRPGRRAAFVLSALAGVALATAVYAGDALSRRLIDRRWQTIAPGYALCAEAESKYQNLAVGRRAEQFTLYCDGQVTADFPDPYTFAPLAHFWMCEHPSPRRVLVLGGGAEGLLSEILRHPIEHVDCVEADPRQIELIEPFLAAPDRIALKDPRVTVHLVDARHFIKMQRDWFDLVIARLAEPTSALRARFYTDEFYGELRRAMTPRAVLCMTAAATPTRLTAAAAEYLASIRESLRRHFSDVIVGWGDPAQILAATADGLITTDPAELTRRYTQRNVHSALFDPVWFNGATDWLDPGKLRERAAELDTARTEISTDLRPIVYVQRLALWERMTGGRSGRIIEWLRTLGAATLTGAIAAVVLAVMVLCRVRDRSCHGWAVGAVIVSVGTTGFATMALSIIWLFAFQNLYGYVYQRIGWIIAIFMGGLVIGCSAVNWRTRRFTRETGTSSAVEGRRDACGAYLWRRLIAADFLIALLALLVPSVLSSLGAMQTTRFAFVLVEGVISILVAVTGVLCGGAFTLAGGLRMNGSAPRAGATDAGDRAAMAAASVVGADHAGACLGALLTGVVLVPVLGTAASAFFLAGIKLGSAVLLMLGRRFF